MRTRCFIHRVLYIDYIIRPPLKDFEKRHSGSGRAGIAAHSLPRDLSCLAAGRTSVDPFIELMPYSKAVSYVKEPKMKLFTVRDPMKRSSGQRCACGSAGRGFLAVSG